MHDWKERSINWTYVILHGSVERNDNETGLDHTTRGCLQCYSHYPYLRGYVYETKLSYILTKTCLAHMAQACSTTLFCNSSVLSFRLS